MDSLKEKMKFIRSSNDSVELDVIEELAKHVLTIAIQGGMPVSFWQTDSRITAACDALGWTADEARDWAENDWEPGQ